MISLTPSLVVWLKKYHKDLLPDAFLGNTEVLTNEMIRDYLEWCRSEEGHEVIHGSNQLCGEDRPTFVKIELLEGGIMPKKQTAGAAAYDCYARESVTVGEDPVLIGLGFKLELPEGYHAEIVPRSSIGLKTNLRQPNCVGVIDSDFRGEVKAMYESKLKSTKIFNNVNQHGIHMGYRTVIDVEPVKIEAGERIAQMLIKKNENVELVQVAELSKTERGEGGFGSTGKK